MRIFTTSPTSGGKLPLLIKDYVATSFHLEIEDLDYTPFDALGGRGRMYQLFGDEMNMVIGELNEVVAA